MKVDIQWKGKMQFETSTPSGHTFSLDAAPDIGGENTGPRPTEALLSAVGSCSGIDIVLILNKMRLNVEAFSMEVSGERAEDYPKRFTKVHMHYRLTGDLPKEQVHRAVKLSVEKYCSVAQSLQADLSATYDINGQTYHL
ncbi:OsmC family protein [Thermoflavimicrobium daqui]|uniref:Peroxiredoxin n=1 Tax=Thermoflavimicrobium daqui TaxID=2137476 RepID=A0A364K390_9BACL|nr:OsmC family protein [Thermoflavimicrobium daqui]RAL23300.1 peroxiredoxin [Thermoflavimicrobium daqui]